ncbi:MAG: RhuM family protein [Desulfonatronovibrio sp.]
MGCFGKDYFRELLERVRSIRASERRIYQQITDIFAECSIDYDPKSETTRNFYAHVIVLYWASEYGLSLMFFSD